MILLLDVLSTTARWCRQRRIVWFSHLPSSPRSLARTNVPWLCNQVKVAQAPPSSRHRWLANSRTIHRGTTTTITTTMPPPAPIRAAGRPEIRSRFTTDGVSYHPRDCVDKIYPAHFLVKILFGLYFATRFTIAFGLKCNCPMLHFICLTWMSRLIIVLRLCIAF